MKKLSIFEYVLYSAIIVCGIGLDQLTKLIAIKHLKPIATFPIIEDVFHFTFTTNDGMAFGMLDNQRWIFLTISTITIVLMGIILYTGRLSNKLYTVSVSMIISGGIGNMIDRLTTGEVVDFLDFRLINFAIFNVADSIVCIGAGILILAMVLDIIKESKMKKSSARSGEDKDGEI